VFETAVGHGKDLAIIKLVANIRILLKAQVLLD
jgi:hypothetical protein